MCVQPDLTELLHESTSLPPHPGSAALPGIAADASSAPTACRRQLYNDDPEMYTRRVRKQAQAIARAAAARGA
jgi:hypothetical protein